jgi:predicted TIM-barrel fold metal-dependent hydrolase
MRIDTHLHVLLPETFSYPWTADFAPLNKRFSLEDYQRDSQDCGISSAIFMEVDVDPKDTASEAEYFCGQAEDPGSGIIGVIASGRPEEEGFEAHLDDIAHPALKGIRRVLHVMPDEVSQSRTFRQNVAKLGGRGLTFDLCVRQDQLGLMPGLIDACPDTQFIVDHCGNPDIAGGDLDTWRKALAPLAERDNVAVKISGIPAACPPGQANAATLRPWVETTISLFGWDRCVWGGDWPVCTLNGTLSSWCAALDDILAAESPENRQKLFTDNARKIYGVSL